jgi:hypothetical protein
LSNRGTWILRRICEMAAEQARIYCLQQTAHCLPAPEQQAKIAIAG